MEKQMDLFRPYDTNSGIWLGLPEETRQKIERIFAEMIAKQLTSSSREIKNHEK
jgi:hypothetical protein